MANSRDEQFQGFAKLLLDELLGEANYAEINGYDERGIAETQELIARRAYDLVAHSVEFVNKMDMLLLQAGMLSGRQVASHIPDMIEFPEDNQ